jgi:hypothetical protein
VVFKTTTINWFDAIALLESDILASPDIQNLFFGSLADSISGWSLNPIPDRSLNRSLIPDRWLRLRIHKGGNRWVMAGWFGPSLLPVVEALVQLPAVESLGRRCSNYLCELVGSDGMRPWRCGWNRPTMALLVRHPDDGFRLDVGLAL